MQRSLEVSWGIYNKTAKKLQNLWKKKTETSREKIGCILKLDQQPLLS